MSVFSLSGEQCHDEWWKNGSCVQQSVSIWRLTPALALTVVVVIVTAPANYWPPTETIYTRAQSITSWRGNGLVTNCGKNRAAVNRMGKTIPAHTATWYDSGKMHRMNITKLKLKQLSEERSDNFQYPSVPRVGLKERILWSVLAECKWRAKWIFWLDSGEG